jgi:hypothetical protein
VPGRPQSASNQTAILTTQPAPQLIGRHVLGYPDAPLRALLHRHSIIRRLREAGRSATFANAYPAAYLDALGLPRRTGERLNVTIPERLQRRLRASATTLAMAAGGVALRTLDDIPRGEALPHDVDGSRARSRGVQLPALGPTEAAQVFWRLAAPEQFTLFEHFLADEAGHARDAKLAVSALSTFDAFARAVIAARPAQAHVLVCSDHGNVEDLSTRSHTLHDVGLLWFGPQVPLAQPLRNVADVGRLVLDLLDTPSGAQP